MWPLFQPNWYLSMGRFESPTDPSLFHVSVKPLQCFATHAAEKRRACVRRAGESNATVASGRPRSRTSGRISDLDGIVSLSLSLPLLRWLISVLGFLVKLGIPAFVWILGVRFLLGSMVSGNGERRRTALSAPPVTWWGAEALLGTLFSIIFFRGGRATRPGASSALYQLMEYRVRVWSNSAILSYSFYFLSWYWLLLLSTYNASNYGSMRRNYKQN